MIALLVAGEVKPRLMPKMTGPNAATATFANVQWHSIEDGLVKKRLSLPRRVPNTFKPTRVDLTNERPREYSL